MAGLRTRNVNVKMSETELSKLNELVEKTHISGSDVLRLLVLNARPEDVMKIPGKTNGKKSG